MFVHVTDWGPPQHGELRGMGVAGEGERDVCAHHFAVPMGGVVAEEYFEHALGAFEGQGQIARGGEVFGGGDVFYPYDGYGITATVQYEVFVGEHPPAHLTFALDNPYLAIGLFAIGAVVVVADYGYGAVGGMELSEDVRGGVQFVGTDGHDVASEDDEVGVEVVDLVDATLQGVGPFQKGAAMDVGQLDQLVAIELCRKVVESNLHLFHLIGVSLDKQSVGQQQYGQQEGE